MLEVREIKQSDIPLLLDYWYSRTAEQLETMGADIGKMPEREVFRSRITEQLNQSYENKKAYATIWLLDGQPIGHNNINKIKYKEEAYMHLHIWDTNMRKSGYGLQLLQKSIPMFFNNFKLKNLFCEPFAKNPAPNKTLEKLGFTLIKKYTTIPGFINFEQEVAKWQLSKEDFEKMHRRI